MCGVFGVYGNRDASLLTYLGLYALQHRGEESAGILSYNKNRIIQRQGMGLVDDVFDKGSIQKLKGSLALGHVRYSTTGSSSASNIQPFLARHGKGHIAIAHNGNFTNAHSLREEMEQKGSVFQTTMDSELIIHMLARLRRKKLKESLGEVFSRLEGAFSVIMLVDGVLIGARDRLGMRPLCIGRLGSSYVLSSETCAFDIIGAKYIRDVKPAEIIFIGRNGLSSVTFDARKSRAHCIFEFIYFARPDSDIFTKNVYLVRKRLGMQLAKEAPVDADMVMPFPDSGNYAALGFAAESGLPFESGMIRNHYVGRTFIQPSQHIRDFRVRIKLNPIKALLKGKRVVIVEDSIVRGTTSRSRVESLRRAGAKEVHMRISCPPVISPCYYGIDFPTKKELIAASRTVDKIRDFIGLDSLHYLSLEGMLKAMPLAGDNFCKACFTRNYPTRIPRKFTKNILEKGR
ncbi:MAG: amidophosphoribosyltransferase [Candidatus Omnitrophica bacterium]|nr:amidophosphoribosyltransferase [Candidatus Omnitrophota bacterium]